MTRFFKSAAFPIIIVIVLAFFASKLISRSDCVRCFELPSYLTGKNPRKNGMVEPNPRRC